MLDTVTAICAKETPTDGAETVDHRRHGRQEHRRIETFDVAGRLNDEWRDLVVSVARVSSLTWHKDTKSRLWHETEEVSFYACQAALPAARVGAANIAKELLRQRPQPASRHGLQGDVIRTEQPCLPPSFVPHTSLALLLMREGVHVERMPGVRLDKVCDAEPLTIQVAYDLLRQDIGPEPRDAYDRMLLDACETDLAAARSGNHGAFPSR